MKMLNLPPFLSLEYSEDITKTLKEEFYLGEAEVAKVKELLNNQVPPVVRPEILSFMFGVSYGLINYLSRSPENCYRVYKISKSKGGTRQIESPRRYLKLIQRWIYENILTKRQLPTYVTGFVRGQSIFTNVQPHLQSRNIMILDINDFSRRLVINKYTKYLEVLVIPEKWPMS